MSTVRRMVLVQAGLLLLLGSSACAGPRLVLQDPKLTQTGVAETPLRWEITVKNDDRRGGFSFCRPGAAKAVITVEAFLTKSPTGNALDNLRLHGMIIADGGDPNSGFRDALEAGDSVTTGFAAEIETDISGYDYIMYRVTSREPPVGAATAIIPSRSCRKWSDRRVERIKALLAAQP